MANIKDPGAISEKWARVTPQRTEDYVQGVQSPRTDWKTATAAASERYKEGVQKSIARNAFGKGVARSGTENWQKGTLEKGSRRWGEGVGIAKGNYAAGFGPYADTIRSTTLPPRYPKGDPRNIDRVKVIADALRKKKESQA
jgi:hypothetical protein